MEQDKTMIEKLAENLLSRPPRVESEERLGDAAIRLLSDGSVYYLRKGEKIRPFHSKARSADGREINTRSAKNRGTTILDIEDVLGLGKKVRTVFEENGLRLYREVILRPGGELTVQLFLSEQKRKTVRSRYLVPIDAPYPDKEGKALFLSLDQKMLLVPYDNDMWTRYESSVPRPGRTSYDITAIYDEESFEGLILGALDFDVWKNAISWAAHDARAFLACSGAADAATHDTMPHGIVSGAEVASARFCMFWSDNIKSGMEHYAALCTRVQPPRPWSGKAIFGWNSYSALGLGLRLSHWEEAGDFIHDALPGFSDEDGVTYINLDGCFGMNPHEIRRIVEKLHARGQKAGWYASPCNCIAPLGNLPIPGTLIPLKNLILEDDRGVPLPPADGSVPLDVTHPLWEQYARHQIRSVLELGFDYIKLDFLSHGGVEGAHYRKDFTGRMALNHAYRILEDELRRADREIFVSLSIAPLFPYFLGNARRCCCDSFGHIEDVRYVLNALNFGWWTNGTLYRYNDPDHLALYHSVVDGRGIIPEADARSRYLSGIISGTLMILSDNYGPQGDPHRIRAARQRTMALAANPRLNALARLGKAFVPVELRSDTTPFYTLAHEGKHYAAIFNFSREPQTLRFCAARGGLPEKGRAVSLLTEGEFPYETEICVTLPGHDCGLFEIK